MKRYISIIVCISLLFTFIITTKNTCNATPLLGTYPSSEVLVSQTVEFLPDGTSILITISEVPVSTYSTSYTKTGTKTYSSRNSNGEILWQFSVQGTFVVNTGVSATCTKAAHSYNILHSDWNYVSGSSHYSGNSAIGDGEFEYKFLFIPIETRTCNVILSCDQNGNLS